MSPDASAQTHGRARAKPKASASAVASTPPPPAPSAAPQASSAPVPRPEARGDGGLLTSALGPPPQELPGGAADSTAQAAIPFPAAEYDRLVGEIAALRARVAEVAEGVFSSRFAVSVQTEGDHAKIGRLQVEVDDASVFVAPVGFRSSEPLVVYDHAVAPGHHTLAVDIDRGDDREPTFRDAQRTRFVVDVPRDDRLAVTLRLGDTSDMARTFPPQHEGVYDVSVRMTAKATPVKR
jgi:hypothetical protein